MRWPDLPDYLDEGEFIPPMFPSQERLTPQREDYSVPEEFWEILVSKEEVRGVAINEHHVYFHRRAYVSRLERDFRNLPDNKQVLPIMAHYNYHRHYVPPVKPPPKIMVQGVVKALNLDGSQTKRFIRRRYGINLDNEWEEKE